MGMGAWQSRGDLGSWYSKGVGVRARWLDQRPAERLRYYRSMGADWVEDWKIGRVEEWKSGRWTVEDDVERTNWNRRGQERTRRGKTPPKVVSCQVRVRELKSKE